MLGLVFIYFVGKTYYELAVLHRKSAWGFAILGVVSYYGGIIVGAFMIGLTLELVSPGTINDNNDSYYGLLGIPVGLLVCWGLYKYLQKNWGKPKEREETGALDGGMIR